MRALSELAGMIVAGFAAFFGGIAIVLGLLFLWLCGLASALCLMVAVFAGVMYWITGIAHDGRIALAYLGYAAVPFVLTFIFGYYLSKFSQARRQRQAIPNISGLRLPQDASFTDDRFSAR